MIYLRHEVYEEVPSWVDIRGINPKTISSLRYEQGGWSLRLQGPLSLGAQGLANRIATRLSLPQHLSWCDIVVMAEENLSGPDNFGFHFDPNLLYSQRIACISKYLATTDDICARLNLPLTFPAAARWGYDAWAYRLDVGDVTVWFNSTGNVPPKAREAYPNVDPQNKDGFYVVKIERLQETTNNLQALIVCWKTLLEAQDGIS